MIDRQTLGDLAHDFGDGWTARLTVLRRATTEDDELFYIYGNPDRTTGDGIFSYPGKFAGETRNLTIEAYLTGKVGIGGREHDIMLGANRGAQSYLQYSSYDYSQVGVPLPLDTLFEANFPRPRLSRLRP